MGVDETHEQMNKIFAAIRNFTINDPKKAKLTFSAMLENPDFLKFSNFPKYNRKLSNCFLSFSYY